MQTQHGEVQRVAKRVQTSLVKYKTYSEAVDDKLKTYEGLIKSLTAKFEDLAGSFA